MDDTERYKNDVVIVLLHSIFDLNTDLIEYAKNGSEGILVNIIYRLEQTTEMINILRKSIESNNEGIDERQQEFIFADKDAER